MKTTEHFWKVAISKIRTTDNSKKIWRSLTLRIFQVWLYVQLLLFERLFLNRLMLFVFKQQVHLMGISTDKTNFSLLNIEHLWLTTFPPSWIPGSFNNSFLLTLLHSERPKLYTILAFLSAIGLKRVWQSHRNKLQYHLILNSWFLKIKVLSRPTLVAGNIQYAVPRKFFWIKHSFYNFSL